MDSKQFAKNLEQRVRMVEKWGSFVSRLENSGLNADHLDKIKVCGPFEINESFDDSEITQICDLLNKA